MSYTTVVIRNDIQEREKAIAHLSSQATKYSLSQSKEPLSVLDENFEIFSTANEKALFNIMDKCREKEVQFHASVDFDEVVGIMTVPYEDEHLRNFIINTRGIHVQ